MMESARENGMWAYPINENRYRADDDGRRHAICGTRIFITPPELNGSTKRDFSMGW